MVPKISRCHGSDDLPKLLNETLQLAIFIRFLVNLCRTSGHSTQEFSFMSTSLALMRACPCVVLLFKYIYQYCIIIQDMSIENILKSERSKYTLPIQKLSEFLYTPVLYQQLRTVLETAPVHYYNPNIYNKSRLALIKDTYSHLPMMFNFFQEHPEYDNYHPSIRSIYSTLVNPHQSPGTAHIGMFVKYIELMGTEEHQKLLYKKSMKYEIVGCYAQTEIGHGSDVRSLETTATFDPKTQEWVINTPSLSAAKYWPGELSFLANYAMVFAQAIVKGKSKGVYPFLVEIKDANYDWMPGIRGGDIGPKLGFHAKENGYMFLSNVRVPKNHLFNKYVEVSSEGDFKIIGDPRVSYGTMMHIREIISCVLPKAYSVPIIIAARYSLFRRQFRNGKKEEVTIMDYQTQQEKVLPRIAEYYALCVGGNKIRDSSERNSENIRKNDFSILQETHSNLSFSKCLYSEIVHEGTETLRRSLGGHGTSYYSGIPQLLNEYAPNNTHEGENTVMYLQTARYVLKSYIGLLTKDKPLTDSVKYLALFPSLADTKFFGRKPWTSDDLRTVLLKGIQYVLGVVTARLASKQPGETEMDIINYKVGLRLQQLAQLHGVYYTVNAFIEANERELTPELKPVLDDLCKLFAISQIQRLSEPILEGGFICPVKYQLLAEEKEAIFGRLRPIVAGLLDSFGIPEKYIRSELARGQPYNNYLDRARECELNHGVQESAKIVSGISHVLAKKQVPKL